MVADLPQRTPSSPDPSGSPAAPTRVLVTGATGYIGGRLVPRLIAKGHQLRCVARNPDRLEGQRWPDVEIVRGDLEDAGDTMRALQGVDVAYYLVHSMAGGEAFHEI